MDDVSKDNDEATSTKEEKKGRPPSVLDSSIEKPGHKDQDLDNTVTDMTEEQVKKDKFQSQRTDSKAEKQGEVASDDGNKKKDQLQDQGSNKEEGRGDEETNLNGDENEDQSLNNLE